MKRRPHQVQDWERSVKEWLRRHEVPEETIQEFMPFIWTKVRHVELLAMRAMAGR